MRVSILWPLWGVLTGTTFAYLRLSHPDMSIVEALGLASLPVTIFCAQHVEPLEKTGQGISVPHP